MTAGKQGPVRVLAVDDEEVNLAVLAALLRAEGWEVFAAKSGEECLKVAARQNPDVILLDVQMPGMNGYETAAALSDDPLTDSIPVVMVTTLKGLDERTRALQAGAVDFLSKPVDPSELKGKVASLARIKRYNDEMKRRQASLEGDLAEAGNQLKTALGSFARFVPQEFLEAVGKPSVLDANLGDNVKRDISILFSDIRGFSSLSEKMSPEDTFAFLNSYLGRMNPFVWENNGFIDKYVGDAIMALFPGGTRSAIAAAVSMLTHIPVYNAQRAEFGYRPIRIGIGVHWGTVMMGIIGHKRFMQGTAISDAVNLGSRLQELTKVYGVSLVISSQALSNLDDPNRFAYRFLDKLKVRGKDEVVSVYEVFDADPSELRERKSTTRGEFEKAAYEFHSARFAQALQLFDTLRSGGDVDPPVEIYRSRCLRALKLGNDGDLAV